MQKVNQNRGFTLVEMLIVIAILGILIAVAVPVFSAFQEKARETVCLENRTSVQHFLTITEATEGINDKDVEQLIAGGVGPLDKLCPSGGQYTVEKKDGAGWVVKCSRHGVTALETVKDNMKTFAELMKQNAYLQQMNGNTSLDSTGPNHGSPLKAQLAKELGIEEAFDFRIYKTMNQTSYYLYVFDSVEGKKEGDVVTATRYEFNADWEQKGTPITGMAPLTTKITRDENNKKVEHLVLKAADFILDDTK